MYPGALGFGNRSASCHIRLRSGVGNTLVQELRYGESQNVFLPSWTKVHVLAEVSLEGLKVLFVPEFFLGFDQPLFLLYTVALGCPSMHEKFSNQANKTHLPRLPLGVPNDP